MHLDLIFSYRFCKIKLSRLEDCGHPNLLTSDSKIKFLKTIKNRCVTKTRINWAACHFISKNSIANMSTS